MISINRREFLSAAATAAALAAGTRAQAADEKKIKLGLIGAGWYGMVDVAAALKAGGVELLAICDVDSDHLNSAADKVEKQQGKRPQTFKNYADLLNSGLDAVIIATPPHWHALPFIAALEKGLDIYAEKPLAYDIREGQAMVEAAKKHPERIVQVGFQRRHAAGFAQAREYIQAGKAGKIVQVEAQINYNAGTKDPTPKDPPPSLDWDLWCGPAPKIPYSDQVGHMNWRLEKTTGQGHLVDWGIHLIDQVRWIMDEKMPKAVSAAGGTYALAGKITTPDILTVHFDFEKCPVTWKHHIWGAEDYSPEVNNGIFFYGEKETVFVTDDKWITIPRFKGKERQTHDAKSDAGLAHMREFLGAVRSRKPASCTVEEAWLSTSTVKLAMISYDTGRKIAWDAAASTISNDAGAAALLKRAYRAPYQHPYAG